MPWRPVSMPELMTRAGLPITIEPGRTFPNTTLPAPTIELSPILAPGKMKLPAPMKQRLPIHVSNWRLFTPSCVKITAPKVTIVSSPIWTPRGLVRSSFAVNEISQSLPIS